MSPVQAGIISFMIAKVSFIFTLLRCSTKLCALFLVILRSAALIEDSRLLVGVSFGCCCCSSRCRRGFIWINLLGLVGGERRARASFFDGCAGGDCRWILNTSHDGIPKDLVDVIEYETAGLV